MHFQDLGLAEHAAMTSQSPILLGTVTRHIYRWHAESDTYRNRDFSSIYQFLKKVANMGAQQEDLTSAIGGGSLSHKSAVATPGSMGQCVSHCDDVSSDWFVFVIGWKR